MAETHKRVAGKHRAFARQATAEDPELGPLNHLPGTWKSKNVGWNMIALPFAQDPLQYRLLLNQYEETLSFSVVGKDVPNRGIGEDLTGQTTETDQSVVSLVYQQVVTQLAADDSPRSELAGTPGQSIHHEPGLWLYMQQPETAGVNVARLSSIPHGNSVLALGNSSELQGPPTIPQIRGLPIGFAGDIDTSPYLAPYRHFRDHPFRDVFDPTRPNELLTTANEDVAISKTTVLQVDSAVETGSISNIPFIVKQANATRMRTTLWIEELAGDHPGQSGPKLRLQYSQVILLEFSTRNDGLPGLIQWPHISINTLEKVSDTAD